MAHSPDGRGQAAAINRRAVPALLHKKKDDTANSSNWRRLHDVETQDINIYIILKRQKLELKEEGDENRQQAALYNTQQKLETGQLIEFPDKGWRFLIRETASRPAINPAYYKAIGVMQD